MLNQVAIAIEHQKQNTLNDIEFKNGIIAEMLPLIAELETIIEVGKQDKEAYDKETEDKIAALQALSRQLFES